VVVGFATGVAVQENDFLWVEAIADAFMKCLRMKIGDLLNGGLGKYHQYALTYLLAIKFFRRRFFGADIGPR
jgi:hypothetical protein